VSSDRGADSSKELWPVGLHARPADMTERVKHHTRPRYCYRRALIANMALVWLWTPLSASAQTLLPNPTPEMYVENNQGGSRVVPNGQLSFDGHPFTCGKFPTVLDPLLNDYAAAPYKGFIILNPKLMPKVSTPVKLWIFHHECGHALGIKDETKADCFSAQRGRRAGWLAPEGLEQVCDFISAGNADAAHASGPERCAAMRACYGRDDANAGKTNRR
jgi:hypothetical protein